MTESALRSALFVDVDNVYLGLQDREAARQFASDPDRWVRWLAGGAGQPGAGGRRFLLKVAYLSPERFSAFREPFVRAGFRVVDCPTGSGRNSADIHLVIDALDAVAAPTRYDEFVIASADSDFAPLLHRLRAHDRRTTVLRGGPAAPAYTSLCDCVLAPEELAAVLLDADGGGARPRRVPAQRGDTPPGLADAVAAVRSLVEASVVPVAGGRAAQAALAACPSLAPRWVGTGSFGGFVAEHLPALRWTSQPTHGYLYDPARQRLSVLPLRAR